jgi:hypothetical protein
MPTQRPYNAPAGGRRVAQRLFPVNSIPDR